ncbi:MAG: ATP-binding protein [Kofleriaceae bacterium]
MPAVSRPLAVVLAVILTAFIAVGDQVTGVDVAFTLLYVAPVALGTWYAGFRHGAWIAMFATACSMVNAMIDQRPVFVTIWNELGLLVVFVSLSYLLERHREHLANERHQHRLTVDQLRHADRLNVIGTLAAGVAHEIGTPLNVISGSAELIPYARAPEEVVEMSNVIREQTERIGSIIRHLLDFGRRAGIKTAPLDLNDLARSSTLLLVPIARKRHAEIAVAPSTSPVPIRGNVAELEQVLSNLVLNAIQAMPKGGTISLRVGVASRPGAGDDRSFGAVTVEDTGVGIAPDALPHIFEPFYTTKGVGEGTGLGLSVSYGIVRDHGGSIEVDSARGHGARFTVLLPLDTAA